MGIDVDKLFKNEAFNGLSVEQKTSFKMLMQKLDGKSASESMSYIMSFMNSMPKQKPLTRKEQDLMLEAISENLPESDKAKFKSILKMLQAMNK